MVVRTDNQSVPKMNLWLSVTIFGCLGQPDNHYYEPCHIRTVENDSELSTGQPRPVAVKCHTFIDAMSELPSGG